VTSPTVFVPRVEDTIGRELGKLGWEIVVSVYPYVLKDTVMVELVFDFHKRFKEARGSGVISQSLEIGR